MTTLEPLLIELEFTRVEQAADPYAFRFAPQEYLLRGAGGSVESSLFSWTESLLADLQEIRRPGRDPAIVARLGETLRRFLAPLSWSEQESRIVAAVAQRRSVLLTIRSSAAELYALPWELVTLKASGQHLAELPSVLLRYEWPGGATISEAAPRPEGGRILFAWSAAAGAVPAKDQLELISRSAATGFYPFDAQRDVLPHVSCGRLVAALQEARQSGNPVSVLHILCHGAAAGSTFGLGLDPDQEGADSVVDGGRLRQLLAPFFDTLRLVILSACDSGNSGELGNQLGSVAQTLHRGGAAAVVASRFPLSVAGSIALTEVLYRELMAGPGSLEHSLRVARSALARDAGSLDWASLQYYARAADGIDTRPLVFRPYRGLLAFHAEHTRFYLGREAERAAALEKLGALRDSRRPSFLIVAGASGTGKSSVVLSGVIPDLLAQNKSTANWQIEVFRPGTDPQAALDSALATHTSPDRPLLLVVDQFEELFTHTSDSAMRRDFASRLWALSQRELTCIITIRVDYLGHCGELILDDSGLRLDRVAYDDAHSLFVAQLGPDQLRAAIEGPAHRVGLQLESGLAARMIAEVEGEPGALPLLSYTLDLLWQKRHGRHLSAQSYSEIGGVIGALESKANAVLDSLSLDEQTQARRILIRLVGLGEGVRDTRRRVALPDLRVSEQARSTSFDAVLAAFVNARLLVLGEEQGQTTVEVAHEALIRKWQRLHGWLAEDRDKLAEIHEIERWVVQWRGYGTLLRDAQLGYAARVLEKYPDDVSSDGRQMITLSQRAADDLQNRELANLQKRAAEDARTARRLRGAAAVLGLALIGALVAGWVARDKTRQAQERFLSLLEQQGRQKLLESDPLRAIVYLAKAYQEGSRDAATRHLLAAAAAETIDRNLVKLVGHSGWLRSVDFSPDGRLAVTASQDQTAILWDVTSGRPLRTLSGHSGAFSSAMFSPDGALIATASDDRTVRLWDVKSGQVVLTLIGHTDALNMAAFSLDGSRIVTSSNDKTARIWDVKSGAELRVISGHEGAVNAARVSADGKRLATASSDGTAKLWNVDDGQTILTLSGHTEAVNGVAFSPDDSRIVTSSQDKTAKIWDAKDGKLLLTFQHDAAVNASAFSPQGDRVLTASLDQTAKIWDARSGRRILQLAGHFDAVIDAAWSADGTRVITGSRDQTARVWDVARPQLLLTIPQWPFSARFSPDGARIVVVGRDKNSQIWDANNGKSLASFAGHTATVVAAEWSLDGRRIVTASSDKTARIWDAASGAAIRTLVGHEGFVRTAAFSPDGSRVVTASVDRTARVWDAASGKLILIITGHAALLYGAAFSPDGRRIVTAGDKLARVWDAGTGQAVLSLAGHADIVLSAAWSPNGAALITSSSDKSARIWDTRSGTLLHVLAGHTATVQSALFSPDGAWAATASEDKTAILWDVKSGKAVLNLVGHHDEVGTATFAPDGRRIATTSKDLTVRFWPIYPETRSPAVVTQLVRCLVPYRLLDEQVVPSSPELAACPPLPKRQTSDFH